MPTALITGCDYGIGFEFARQYIDDGWHIHAICLDPASRDKVEALGPTIHFHPLDVSDRLALAALARQLEGEAMNSRGDMALVAAFQHQVKSLKRSISEAEGEAAEAKASVAKVEKLREVAEAKLAKAEKAAEAHGDLLKRLKGSLGERVEDVRGEGSAIVEQETAGSDSDGDAKGVPAMDDEDAFLFAGE